MDMIIRKLFILILVLLVSMAVFSACGTKSGSSGTVKESEHQTGAQQSEGGRAAETTALPEDDSVEQTLPSVDTAVGVEKLLGSWTDINDKKRFANITKRDSGYQYEDNDGTYSADFKDGILEIKVSESDTADAYIDPKTGHMLLVYQDNLSEYLRN